MREEGNSYANLLKPVKLMKLLTEKSTINSPRRVERHLNLRLLPILVGGLVILYVLTGFRGWLVFTLGIAGAWFIAAVWIYSMERNLGIERKIHLAWATVGESVPEEVLLINHGWLPAIWVEITDESSSLETPLRLVSDVARHSHRTRHLNHLFKKRGLYTLGPTRLRSGDPFGIYTLTLMDQHASTILVTPPVLPLLQLKVPIGGLSGDEYQRRGYIERNISDAGLRNYVAGDSLRRIHWRASAHFDNLIVRQLESATSRDWWIFVDLNSTEQVGVGEHTTLELSIVLAASLALRGLKEYRQVGLVLAGPQLVWLEPSADPAQGWRILRALAMAQAGNYSLSDLLIQSQQNLSAMVILITPSGNPTWVATADRHRKGGSTLAMLVDPTDFGSSVDQANVISALARRQIPFVRIPGSVLDEAYASSKHGESKRISGGEPGKRYLLQERQSWQSMD
jgi:uncharacterized protein (DUF58 family)